MGFSFYALVSRMKNISRWALMRNSRTENVQEHSHMVAVLAHALAVIRRDVMGQSCDPDKAAAAALFHDASEIYTGDMPTPVKYLNPEIQGAYKQVESAANLRLLDTLPPALRPAYRDILLSEGGQELQPLIKAADTLSAYIKCLEELQAGNNEFVQAARQTHQKLLDMRMPEVDYFIEQFIPSFELTLDELSLSGK